VKKKTKTKNPRKPAAIHSAEGFLKSFTPYRPFIGKFKTAKWNP